MAKLDKRSEERLKGVDEALQAIVHMAAVVCPIPFIVVEGLRSLERQKELYAQGRTKPGKVVTWTMKSKHLEGLAVDLAPIRPEDGSIDWDNTIGFNAISQNMFASAKALGHEIRWGADWDNDGKPRERGETDSPHFELV